MANYSTHVCTLCQEDEVSTRAVSWCLECEDWFCSDCEKHHGRSKTSKQQKTITVSDYATLPPSVITISNRCTEDHERFESFCSFHGSPCCIQCVSEIHKECELRPLDDVLQNTKESSAVYHLERDLNEIQKNLEVIEKHLLERIAKVEDESKHCLKELTRIRASVNEHMDKIERNTLDKLSQKGKTVKKTIEMLASQIESKKRRIVNYQDLLLTTKLYATDFQIFLTIREMEKQTFEGAQYLEDIEKGNIMINSSLKLVVSPELQSLQRDVVKFADISVHSIPSILHLSRTSHGQSQMLVHSPVFSTLDKVNLVKKSTIKLPDNPSVITACAIFPTGECVFADYNNDRMVLYDSKGSYVRNIVQSSGQSADMCYVKDSIVGISFPDEKNVDFVEVFKNKIVKTITMESGCYGIECDDGKLFARLLSPDGEFVVVIYLEVKRKQCINIPGENVTRIACFKNHIYCTDCVISEVVCYDTNDTMVWKHKYEALIYPQSITIDKRSDIIYVAGLDSNSLLAISLDGDQSKIVLSKIDGLNEVLSVHVSTKNKLLVCNSENGTAFLYQL